MDPYVAYARFYDLDLAGFDDDLLMVEEFARRCGSPILELGCGSGRLLLPLARRGYQVTGVDLSPAMLAIARRKVEAEGLGDRVRLTEQDMRDLALEGRFRLALLALGSFAHILTLEDQLRVLAGAGRHLHPGGLLLLDLPNPDLARLLQPGGQVTLERVMADPEAGCTVLKYYTQQADPAGQILHVTLVVDEVDGSGGVQRTLFPYDVRYVFRYELELLLRHAGFQVEAVYGSYDLDEVHAGSERLIAVARWPGGGAA